MQKKVFWLAALSLAVILAIIGVASTILSGKAPRKPAGVLRQSMPIEGQYAGPISCASGNCHGRSKPPWPPQDVQFRVRQDEYFTWVKFDKHSRAYKVLLNSQSLVIARNLRLETKPHETPRCLGCHALNVPKNAEFKILDISQGISCEACHGPASGWITRHTEEKWIHTDSVKAGMVNLRDPLVRAQTCLNCHLGTPDKNVDHELIAAGHPDLTFELDNYSDRMPRHWASFKERNETIRLQEGREETEGVRAWIAGQAVAFQRGLLLLANRASGAKWPEPAEMDCYACHHSLKDKNWRQVNGPTSGLGLPPWSPARVAMMRHIAAVLAPVQLEKMEIGIKQLSGFMVKANGDGKLVSSAATGLAEAIKPILTRIGQSPVDSRQLRHFTARIVDDANTMFAKDIRSAEQAVLALNTLVSEIAGTSSMQRRNELTKALTPLFNDVEPPNTFDPEVFRKHMLDLQRLLSADD